jgi:hypothetical protein
VSQMQAPDYLQSVVDDAEEYVERESMTPGEVFQDLAQKKK